MEISAADLRRSSRSSCSVFFTTFSGSGIEEGVGPDDPKVALETSSGWGLVAEDVVALQFRRAAGGAWIWTCLWVEVEVAL